MCTILPKIMPGKVFNKDVVSGLIQTTKLLLGLAIIDKRKKIVDFSR